MFPHFSIQTPIWHLNVLRTCSIQQMFRKQALKALQPLRGWCLGCFPYCVSITSPKWTFPSQTAIKGLCFFQIPGTSSVVQRKWKPLQPVPQPRGPGQQTKSRVSAVAAEIKQIRARRKTARMLMVVLLVFAICYLPISILNVLKR